MSFIRSKNVKGHTYYYLVSTKRVNGKVVQKFEKYVGKDASGHKPAIEKIEVEEKNPAENQQ